MRAEESERILIVAPFGRDAEAAVKMLERARLDSTTFSDIRTACKTALETGAGAIVVGEEMMTTPQLGVLAQLLEEQPPWSDLPVIVLARAAEDDGRERLGNLHRFNVTILERPLYVRTFIAAVKVSLRARRRQYEVRRLLESAQAANRAKDEFLAMLGHELRNPLSPIVVALHLIRMRRPAGIERELTIVDRQVAHLSRLVDDLLDVSRIAKGKVEIHHEVVAVGEAVARAVEMTSPLFEQRHQHLEVVRPQGSMWVRGDAMRLAQVLANLLTNASKYTPAGGTIELRCEAADDEAVLQVRDEGIGITPEMLSRVFDLFTQERQAIDRAQGGLGLGLAIVRSLVHLHGGTVEASSPGLGKGSTFTVRLPRLVTSQLPLQPTRDTTTAVFKERSLRRILIVDDNEDAADTLADTLMDSGYATRIAHDGPDALRVAEEFRPDLAVLDIGLPVMDGYELANRLRELPQLGRLRLVAVTGYGRQEDIRKAHEAGFDEHLVKPITIDRLNETVERLLSA